MRRPKTSLKMTKYSLLYNTKYRNFVIKYTLPAILESGKNNISKKQAGLTTLMYLSMVLQSFVWPWSFFSVSKSYAEPLGLLGKMSPSQGHYLHEGQHKHANRHPCFEWDSKQRPSVFEWSKTVHALDRALTKIGLTYFTVREFMNIKIERDVIHMSSL